MLTCQRHMNNNLHTMTLNTRATYLALNANGLTPRIQGPLRHTLSYPGSTIRRTRRLIFRSNRRTSGAISNILNKTKRYIRRLLANLFRTIRVRHRRTRRRLRVTTRGINRQLRHLACHIPDISTPLLRTNASANGPPRRNIPLIHCPLHHHHSDNLRIIPIRRRRHSCHSGHRGRNGSQRGDRVRQTLHSYRSNDRNTMHNRNHIRHSSGHHGHHCSASGQRRPQNILLRPDNRLNGFHHRLYRGQRRYLTGDNLNILRHHHRTLLLTL